MRGDHTRAGLAAALLGAALLGLIAGSAAFFAALATGSELLAAAVVAVAPIAARLLYPGFGRGGYVVLGAIGAGAAVLALMAALSGYST